VLAVELRLLRAGIGHSALSHPALSWLRRFLLPRLWNRLRANWMRSKERKGGKSGEELGDLQQVGFL
jgi:hypothetical protein